jgi:hypothetical protein
MLPNIAKAQHASTVLSAAAFSWASRDGYLKRPLATKMVDALFRGLRIKSDEDGVEGMLSMIESQRMGAVSGLWAPVDITPTVLALACQKLLNVHGFPHLKPSDLHSACKDASSRIKWAYEDADEFVDEFVELDAVLLEFAHDEWEKPWLLPQYRPSLGRVLQQHSHRGTEGDAFAELVDREQAKLALEKPPEQKKFAPTGVSRRGDRNH